MAKVESVVKKNQQHFHHRNLEKFAKKTPLNSDFSKASRKDSNPAAIVSKKP